MSWSTRRLGELAKFRNGLNFAASDRDGDLPVVGVGDFGRGRLASSQGLETVKRPRDLAEDALLKQGDLLFVRSNGNPELVGRCMLVEALDGPTTHSGFTIRARITSPLLDTRWAAAFFESGLARRALGLGASGTNISNLSQGILADVEIPLPPLDAQRRTLSLLGRFESNIAETDRLLEAKRTLRHGLMRELLTARRRFPNFQKTGEWQEVAIGRLLELVTRPVDWDDAAVYRLASIRRRNGGFFAREERQGADIKTKSLFTVKTGDFVISRMQAVHGALAVVTPEFDGWQVSGMYMVLRPKHPQRIRTEFLHYLSHLRAMYRNVFLSCHGVHIEKMTFDPKKFLKTKVLVPPTLAEQDRITDVLHHADQEVELTEAVLSARQQERRVFMQRVLSGDLTLPEGRPPTAEPAHA